MSPSVTRVIAPSDGAGTVVVVVDCGAVVVVDGASVVTVVGTVEVVDGTAVVAVVGTVVVVVGRPPPGG
jgi:hypothetical protein